MSRIFSPLWDAFTFVVSHWFGVDLHADRVSRGGSAQAKVGLLCSNPVSCADVLGVLEQQVSQPGPRFHTSAPVSDVLAEKRRQLGEYLTFCWWDLPRQNAKCHLWSTFFLNSFPAPNWWESDGCPGHCSHQKDSIMVNSQPSSIPFFLSFSIILSILLPPQTHMQEDYHDSSSRPIPGMELSFIALLELGNLAISPI